MRRNLPACAGLVLIVLTLTVACSSGNDQSGGSLSVAMGASLGTAAASSLWDGPLSNLQAATITVSSIEAHQTSGNWVVIDAGLPATVDLLAILNGSSPVTLPADAIPEGSYDGLQVTITQVDLTLMDGTHVLITPPAGGWVVRIPVDFTVVAGQVTEITLQVRCDRSFHLIGSDFVFDPEVEVEGVAHH